MRPAIPMDATTWARTRKPTFAGPTAVGQFVLYVEVEPITGEPVWALGWAQALDDAREIALGELIKNVLMIRPPVWEPPGLRTLS